MNSLERTARIAGLLYVNTITFPLLFGELALALWLLIVGIRPKPRVDPAPASGQHP